MATNLDYLSGNPAAERKGLPEKPSPVERDLELMARHTLHDFNASHRPVRDLDTTTFPLTIYYARRDGDSTNISVGMRTSQKKVFYQSSYMPVFRAVSLAHSLDSLFKKNHYGCDITREIVEDD